MKPLKRAALVAQLVIELRDAGSWCGETHVQKALYLLQGLLEVPTNYEFILYKHGPFSFEFSDELASLRGDGLLALQPQSPPYGPRYAVTTLGEKLCGKFPKTLRTFDSRLKEVAKVIGARTVGELERLATALYVTKNEQTNGTIDGRAQCLNQLKPHVSLELARKAVEEVDALIGRFPQSVQ